MLIKETEFQLKVNQLAFALCGGGSSGPKLRGGSARVSVRSVVRGPIAAGENYRSLFLKEFPGLPKGWQVHHILPQKFKSIMSKAGINIHEVQYLRGVDPKIHFKITSEWAKWEKGLGHTPTAREIQNFANTIDVRYRQYWYTN